MKSIESKLKGLFFYTISSGVYDDFGLEYVVCSTKEISHDQWEQQVDEFRSDKNDLENKLTEQGLSSDEIYDRMEIWIRLNNPVESFIDEHDLYVVDTKADFSWEGYDPY